MNLDFNKNTDGLVPAIIQDATTQKVLMLGYMNAEALSQPRQPEKLLFLAEQKTASGPKEEESGNFLELVSIKEDCDQDTLLIQVNPARTNLSQRNRHLLGRIEYV